MARKMAIGGKAGFALLVALGGALALAWRVVDRRLGFDLAIDDYDPWAVD